VTLSALSVKSAWMSKIQMTA